jgi:hypothetical protein
MGGKAAAALVLLTLGAAGCGGAGKPHFRSAAGWHLLSGRNELAAANVQFASADRSTASPPSRTVATLPRDGIVIWAMVGRESRHPPSSPTPLPLRLSEAVPTNPFEGFGCAPAVPVARCYAASGSVRRFVGQAGSYFVELYVFFGTDRPAVASVAAANAELARLRLPRVRARAEGRVCPARTGRHAYDTTLSPASGPRGSVVTVSGHLPAVGEDGSYGGQTAKRVEAYWNLDFARWWTALTGSPSPSIAGRPVRLLGRQGVAGSCRYSVQVRIPAVRRGRYPIEVLYGQGKSDASFAPVTFRVTAG